MRQALPWSISSVDALCMGKLHAPQKMSKAESMRWGQDRGRIVDATLRMEKQ